MLQIRELPAELQPANRIRLHSPKVLTDYELLAIVTSCVSLESAEALLSKAGSLKALSQMGLEEIAKIDGLGMKAATQVRASLELARRMGEEEPVVRQIRSANDAWCRLRFIEHEEQEHLVVLLLNQKNVIIAIEELYAGTVNACHVRVAEIFKLAVRRGAVSIILGHNHPSGDPTPSPEDVRMTESCIEAGQLMDIDVLDHLVIGLDRFYSMKEHKLAAFK